MIRLSKPYLWFVILRDLLSDADTTATRLALALGSTTWGVMLLWPGATFGYPSYSLMSVFMSEISWGSLFLGHGLYTMYSVVYVKHGKLPFLIEGALGCALWTGSCLCLLLATYPPQASLASEIALAFFSWWHLVRFPLNPSR